MNRVWVGVDVGKEHHWACALGHEGRVLVSRRVANDEADILALLAQIADLGMDEVAWAVDLTTVEAALLLAMLGGHGQPVRYLPGKAVNHAAAGYRGEGKTDCGHDRRGVLRVAGPEDRSATCLLGDTSATERTPLGVPGRTRCGLIGA